LRYRTSMHFEKHLVRVGNSLGIVLDKTVLRKMGLGRKTKVRVRTDGNLIVIEPVAKPAFDPARAEREIHAIRLACALDTARALDDSLSPDQMAELGAGRMLVSSYRNLLATKTSFDARWLMVIERLDRVRQAFDADRNSVEAVSEAIAAVPGVPGMSIDKKLS
jgi:antitoxin component of MazEF toxin-antitoxin module